MPALAEVTPPIIVAVEEDCAFYRSASDAVARAPDVAARIFDAFGQRLEVVDAELSVVRTDPDGPAELGDLLRDWLGAMDAIRESTVNWSLALLVRASADHLGYSA